MRAIRIAEARRLERLIDEALDDRGDGFEKDGVPSDEPRGQLYLEELLELARSSSGQTRELAVHNLAEFFPDHVIRARDTDLLAEIRTFLDEATPDERRLLLAVCAERRAREPLRGFLLELTASRHADVRRAAWGLLAELAGRDGEPEGMVRRLRDAVSDADPLVRADAALYLGHLYDDPADVTRFMAALRGEQNPDAGAALVASVRAREPEAGWARLDAAARDDTQREAWRRWWSLAGGTVDTAPAPEPAVSAPPRPAGVDADPVTNRYLARLVEDFEKPLAADPRAALDQFARGRLIETRRQILDRFAERHPTYARTTGDRSYLPFVAGVAREGGDRHERAAALKALTGLEDGAVVDLLADLAKAAPVDVREGVVERLRDIGGAQADRALRLLADLLDDPEQRIRTAAAKALGGRPEADLARDALLRRLRAEDNRWVIEPIVASVVALQSDRARAEQMLRAAVSDPERRALVDRALAALD